MADPIDTTTATEDELRDQAVASIKRKRDFKNSALAYVVVNIALVIIWASVSS